MNLIGHLACAQALHAAARLGAILPDLVPLYDRRCKVAPLVKHWSAADGVDPALSHVSAGITFHLLVDAHFHRLPLFREPYRALRRALESAGGTPGLKRILTAHVLLEMFMDHLLLQDWPALGEDFHGLLAGHGPLIERYCAPQPRFAAQGFRGFLSAMRSEAFLDGYRSIDALLARMNRIQLRHGQRALEPAEADAARGFLTGRQAWLREELHAFVQAATARSGEFASAAGSPRAQGQAPRHVGSALGPWA